MFLYAPYKHFYTISAYTAVSNATKNPITRKKYEQFIHMCLKMLIK
jgi:hypothetical protein